MTKASSLAACRLGAPVAAGAEADVLLEADRARLVPELRDVLPAAVGRARVDDDSLDALGVRVPGERAQRGRQAIGAVVVDENDGELELFSVHARSYIGGALRAQAARRSCRRAFSRSDSSKRESLRERLVLLRQAGEHGRVVQEHDEHEEARDHVEGRRRVGDARRIGEAVEGSTPDGEHEHDEPGDDPEQRVALMELATPDEIDDDAEHDEDGEARNECETSGGIGHLASAGRGRKRPTKRASETLPM